MKRVGGPLAVKDSFSVYELLVLDAEGNPISVGYGVLNSKGMLIHSFLSLKEAVDSLHLTVDSDVSSCTP
jgi:hypothetical protein